MVDAGDFGLQEIFTFDFFSDTNIADSSQSSFNDLGQLAINFTFGGGNVGGVLVSNVVAIPEPGSLALLLSLSGVFALRRSR